MVPAAQPGQVYIHTCNYITISRVTGDTPDDDDWFDWFFPKATGPHSLMTVYLVWNKSLDFEIRRRLYKAVTRTSHNVECLLCFL